jgi:transposase
MEISLIARGFQLPSADDSFEEKKYTTAAYLRKYTTFRQPLGHRRPSTTATIVGPSAVSGSAFSRKWRPPVQFLTSFPSPAAMSRRTARRLVQKGGFAEAIGRSRGGRTSQIHALADDRGSPVAFALTPGNVADITMAAPLLGAVARPKRLLADKAYDADSLRKWLKHRKVKAVVPSTASRRTPYPLDSRAYKRRNLIERMFCKLKNWRRIATRYDRYAQNYLSGLALAAIMIAWI